MDNRSGKMRFDATVYAIFVMPLLIRGSGALEVAQEEDSRFRRELKFNAGDMYSDLPKPSGHAYR